MPRGSPPAHPQTARGRGASRSTGEESAAARGKTAAKPEADKPSNLLEPLGGLSQTRRQAAKTTLEGAGLPTSVC
eukprot:1839293-Pyramimonas_sp.AAC.1